MRFAMTHAIQCREKKMHSSNLNHVVVNLIKYCISLSTKDESRNWKRFAENLVWLFRFLKRLSTESEQNFVR